MIRLGVVGFGRRAQGLVNHVFREVEPDLRVACVVDADEAGARQRLAEADRKDVAFYPTLDEMVRKGRPDALLISTRCHLHTPYAVQAAAYDLPLYLEKPVAISLEQAQSLERAFAKARGPVVVSFPLRTSPLCMLAKQYIEGGAVGDPVHVAAVNYVSYGWVYWEQPYRNFEMTQGLFLQKATHDVDYIAWLMNSPIVRVGAMWTRGRVFGGTKPAGLVCSKCDEALSCLESPENRKRSQTTGTVEDHACLYSVDCGSPETGTNEDCSSLVMEFASGAHGVYTQVFFTRRDAETRGATISGYQGTLSFDWYKNELRRVRHHAPFTTTDRAGGVVSHFGGDHVLARNFLDVVRGRATSCTPIETGIQSAYICLAAKQSAETGQFVKVPQVGM